MAKADDVSESVKRRSMVVGVAIMDDHHTPRFVLGCYYSKLKPEGIIALEAAFDRPDVKAAFDEFIDVFGEAAGDMGVEAAVQAGADKEVVAKIAKYKEESRAKKAKNQPGNRQPGDRTGR